MKNLIQQQEELRERFSEQQLIKEMQMPSGVYDQFLVLTELQRRKRIDDDQARKEAADDTKTVAQEVVNAAGVPQSGIAQLASTMNAKTDNTQNTGVQKMADGGVVKMQTAGKPPSVMSNIMSLMNPYSVKNITDYNPTVAKEPEMTGLEQFEFEALKKIDPEAAEALEISKKIQAGKAVKSVLKEAGMTGLEAANLIVGAAVFISADTANAVLNNIGLVLPDEQARKLFKLATAIENRAVDNLFKEDGRWFQRNLPRLNPDFAYNFADRKTKAEELTLEQLNDIKQEGIAGVNRAIADLYGIPVDKVGDPSYRPTTKDEPANLDRSTVLSEGTPVEFLKGTPKNVPETLPFGPKDSFDAFGDPARSRFTKGFPRNLDLVGSPQTAVDGFTTGQSTIPQGDVFPSGPLAVAPKPEPAVRPDVAEEISRLGRPIQTSISQQPPSTSSIIKPPLADDPFRLGGAAKEEQLRNFIATEDPKFYGPAAKEMGQRAREFYNTNTFTPPSEIYGSTDVYGPELGALFKQTLENQQKAMPGGGGRSGLGALFAQTLENQQEGIPGGTDPNAKPTLQSRFDKAKLYLEGLGEDVRGMTQEDVIEFAKSLGAKGLELIDDVAQAGSDFLTTRANNKASRAFDSDTLGVGSDPIDFRAIDKATAEQLKEEQGATDTATQSQIDKLMELLNKQQGAIDKQSGASSAALSEFLGGLEKDREFDKAMALANAGAALMMPSATFGEGASKAVKAGTSTLQKGKDSYNKTKLQLLALQGRIDAAKAAAANRSAISGATLSSRILLARREELADQLERLAPLGTKPKGEFADRVKELKRAIKQTDDQLNAMIMTASVGSIPAGSDIFASYNLTG